MKSIYKHLVFQILAIVPIVLSLFVTLFVLSVRSAQPSLDFISFYRFVGNNVGILFPFTILASFILLYDFFYLFFKKRLELFESKLILGFFIILSFITVCFLVLSVYLSVTFIPQGI